MEELPGFLTAAFALCGSPGPAPMTLAATGAAFGARRGLAFMAGIDAGMGLVMAITASGMVGLLMALPGAGPAVTLLAAAYFLYLAWRIASAPPLSDRDGGGRQPRFAAGVLLSLVNPKAYAAMAALYSGFVLVDGDVTADIAAKFLILAGIICSVNLAWLLAGAALTRYLRDPRASRAINLSFAAALVASVAMTLVL